MMMLRRAGVQYLLNVPTFIIVTSTAYVRTFCGASKTAESNRHSSSRFPLTCFMWFTPW